MSEEKHEALSALVDGELPAEDGPRLLDQVIENASLKQRWTVYHLIGDVIRTHGIDRQSLNGQGVRGGNAAARRPFLAPSRVRGMHPLAGLALAASVAAVAVLGILAVSEPKNPAVEVAQTLPSPQPPESSGPEPVSVVAGGSLGIDLTRMTWNDAAPAVTTRLNGYLVTHSEYLTNGMRGMLPYARIVAYDGEQN